MKFIDEVEIEVIGGRGGDGSAAMRREKFVPLGGPAGGDGGRGGHVIFVAHEGLHTLIDLQFRQMIRAENGEHGRGKDQYGKTGRDITVRVPVGTQVYDAASNAMLGDLSHHGMELIVAEGGGGGRGNKHFATAYNRAPRQCEAGHPGEHKRLRLELKLMADVGLVGLPNAGKSTFLSKVSRARPKIADYPFTTLTPQLGVVSLGEGRSYVVADIPGIIAGASQGAGLGLQFLRHIERTRVLLILLTKSEDPDQSPLKDYEHVIEELGQFSADLLSKPRVIALSQCDRPEVREVYRETKQSFAQMDQELHLLSSISGEGLDDLLHELERLVGDSSPVQKKTVNPLPVGH